MRFLVNRKSKVIHDAALRLHGVVCFHQVVGHAQQPTALGSMAPCDFEQVRQLTLAGSSSGRPDVDQQSLASVALQDGHEGLIADDLQLVLGFDRQARASLGGLAFGTGDQPKCHDRQEACERESA